jgi:hypothetical protein
MDKLILERPLDDTFDAAPALKGGIIDGILYEVD